MEGKGMIVPLKMMILGRPGGPVLYNASTGASCNETTARNACPGMATEGAAVLGINCSMHCTAAYCTSNGHLFLENAEIMENFP